MECFIGFRIVMLVVDTSELIVGFDVGREEFRVLIPPPDYRHRQARHNFDLSLRELGGQLCLVDFTPEEHLVIWVMKEYGVGASWRKEYVVERPLIGLNRKFIGPLCLMKNEKILFSCSGGTFMRYDPVDQRFQVLRIQGLPPHYCLFTHVGSLVSLRDAERITSDFSYSFVSFAFSVNREAELTVEDGLQPTRILFS
ncbi:hypothetical protein L1049_001166 [Liquidambar formosana]|uniref:F-box associated domain-containing protein n=1 Tax=Liquidambar formosana TaxID=63359 RepID=A0AAP0NB09_LIQFO